MHNSFENFSTMAPTSLTSERFNKDTQLIKDMKDAIKKLQATVKLKEKENLALNRHFHLESNKFHQKIKDFDRVKGELESAT